MLIRSLLLRIVPERPEMARRPPNARQPIAADAFAVPALERAFLRVRANDGGPGADGVTLAAFDRSRAERLGALSAALATGVYRPGPLRRVTLRKSDGGARLLAIPCVADRVVQTAWLFALAPLLESRMHTTSYAYRSGRGVVDALAAARGHVSAGRPYVAKIDIRRFFDNVPHGRLFAELPGWVDDKRFLTLAQAWARDAAPDGRGLPQGSPLSPALANVFLDPIDRAMAAEGLVIVRYADDVAAFCRSAAEARAALIRVGELLSNRGLDINMEKSRVAHAREGIRLLGEILVPARLRWIDKAARFARGLFSASRSGPTPTA